MSIEIIGAGMAGLLAANMLKHRSPTIYEKQSELPNNHSAVLRFRSSIVGDVLNIPFKKVKMIKASLPWLNPVADALAYSRKNTGISRSDRSIIDGTVIADRWIAPPDLISRMAQSSSIIYNANFSHKPHLEPGDCPYISTIPMPALMEALDYPKRSQFNFKGTAGNNIKVRIQNCDAYVSLLIPDPDIYFSRLSLTGDELIIEGIDPEDYFPERTVVWEACELLGVEPDLQSVTVHNQTYAKLLPIDDDGRKEFIHWATDKFGIFSLGRFATWRPGLLLDDLVQDIRLIDKWIDRRYELNRSR